MSAFSNLSSHAVLPLGAYGLDELKKAARHADQRLLYANLAGHGDKAGVLTALAKAFALQAHFGHNLDALYDCITDLKPIEGIEQPGFVVILENLPDGKNFGIEQRAALLDVFREAADYFFDKNTAFRVFYSVVKTST